MWWNNFLYWAGTKMIIAAHNNESPLDERNLSMRITNWLASDARKTQIIGEQYYIGQHDILQKKRTVIGQDGTIQEVHNLPNNKRIDNQYAKYVDQKKNYILGKPVSFDCEDEEYVTKIKKVLNKKFKKMLKDVGEDCLNGGIAWVCPYYNDKGELMFKNFPAYEILPFWNDRNHTDLEMAVRLYLEEKPNATSEYEVIQKVELYTKDGIEYFIFEGNKLIPDVTKEKSPYLTVNGEGRNWDRIPLIPFKLNGKEIPLIKRCKGLQDAVNDIISSFKDNMEEDSRNTIIVLDNYDGQDLGEFRKNLAQFGAVKVRSGDGAKGDVRTLHIEVNYANYESILAIFRTAIKHNCRGYDYSDLNKAAADPNQMNIKSILSDVDIDANDMETEFQTAFEELLWFVNRHLGITDEPEVNVIFNRDGIINEVEIAQMLIAWGCRVSQRTLLNQVPFVNDVDAELALVEEEDKKAMDAYGGMLPTNGMNGANSPVDQTNKKLKQMGGTPYAKTNTK